jgi:hypothetical protein
MTMVTVVTIVRAYLVVSVAEAALTIARMPVRMAFGIVVLVHVLPTRMLAHLPRQGVELLPRPGAVVVLVVLEPLVFIEAEQNAAVIRPWTTVSLADEPRPSYSCSRERGSVWACVTGFTHQWRQHNDFAQE